jgi:hypothetical protein
LHWEGHSRSGPSLLTAISDTISTPVVLSKRCASDAIVSGFSSFKQMESGWWLKSKLVGRVRAPSGDRTGLSTFGRYFPGTNRAGLRIHVESQHIPHYVGSEMANHLLLLGW